MVNYFIKIGDKDLVSFETRFKQIQNCEKTFGLLFDLKKLKLANDDEGVFRRRFDAKSEQRTNEREEERKTMVGQMRSKEIG